MPYKKFACLLIGISACASALACGEAVSVCGKDMRGSFGLIRSGRPTAVYVDKGADQALVHMSRNFVADLERVSGQPAPLLNDIAVAGHELVIIGELGRSPVLDQLVTDGKLNVDGLKGQWEAYRQVVVEHPFKGVARALVIVGSDRRGAVFGAYDISARIGVSPWYWWADVSVAKQANVFMTAGTRRDQPKVKYRGIFINDEDPGFSSWARAKFGGVNSNAYSAVFELMLRLKSNYLWPAMWTPKAFNADDPQSMVLADEMGIIMGTSHHEPMMRAHDEWNRFKGGKWDYASNGTKLREFWRGGVERMVFKGDGTPYESLLTVGMRGDGDEPMSEGTAIQLLEGIVNDQRQIIADVTGKPATQTPQMWALYKEVQDYYDKGMKVPDDVLLLFADDNWGNIRRLPSQNKDRQGGYGVYYHFDYVGGPRNYKWLNTNQIEKTWQQMNLAYARGVDRLWIVNVGDIKPMEFPTSFFLDMAWNPDRMSLQAMETYAHQWAAAQFGSALGPDIAEIVTRYSQYAARRKPELVDPRSFSLGRASAQALDGGEFGTRVAEWDALEKKVATVKASLRPEQWDAYFQLVEHPVLALANLYRLYYYAAWNAKLAAVGDARANVFADLAQATFRRDQDITDHYHALNGGKWTGMMLQTHIGYTSWQAPREQIMPAIQRVAAVQSGRVSVDKVMKQLKRGTLSGAGQKPGVVTIDASSFKRSFAGKGLQWTVIANLGHGQGAVTALPQGHESTTLADNVRVEYDFQTSKPGDATLAIHMVPTLDTRQSGSGIKLAASIDDQAVQILTLNLLPTAGPEQTSQERAWASAVKDSESILSARFQSLKPGRHVIRLWRLDDNAVVQKLFVELHGGSQ